jgi:hypothetical protein
VEETPGRARFDIQNPEVNLTRMERSWKGHARNFSRKEDNGRNF